MNADLPPKPEAPKEEAIPKAKGEPQEEVMEEEEDPESDLELDMTGVIGKSTLRGSFSVPLIVRFLKVHERDKMFVNFFRGCLFESQRSA